MAWSTNRILVMAFAVVLAFSTGVTAYLVDRGGRRGIEAVASLLQHELASRIDHEIAAYVSASHEIVALNARDVGSLADLRGLQHLFWNQLQSHPDLTAVFAANARKGFAGVERRPDSSLTKTYSGPESDFAFTTHVVDGEGRPLELARVLPDYDPSTRPYYKTAERERRQVWTEIYPFPLHNSLYLASVAWIEPKSGPPGVVAAALSLGRVNAFLRGLKVGENGRAFIVDGQGLLVASGQDEPPFRIEAGQYVRLSADESADPLIRRAAEALAARRGDFESPRQWRLDDDGEPLLLHVQPFADGRGLRWLVGIVVSEADFLGAAKENYTNVLLLDLLALVAALGLAAYLASWVTAPLRALVAASDRLAGGALDERVTPSGPSDVRQLGRSFNAMADQLAESLRNLEQRVEARTAELDAANAGLLREIASRHQ